MIEKIQVNYFDRRSCEEDTPVELSPFINSKYAQIEVIYEDFFDRSSLSLAKTYSKEERDTKGLNDSSFVYGEIVNYFNIQTFRSVAYIFEYIKQSFGNDIKEGNFFDLGSGIGRAIVAATFLHPFKSCIGIEYLEKLHMISSDVKEKYDIKFEEIAKLHQDILPSYVKLPQLEIINGDFLLSSWEDASVVLANSTCFSQELMLKLTDKAEKELTKGAFFITFTKRLTNLSDNWAVKDGFRRLMSWGIATVYLHKKLK